jgi:hypothetical protein
VDGVSSAIADRREPEKPALASESEQEHHGRVVYFMLPPIRRVIAAAHRANAGLNGPVAGGEEFHI